MKYKVLVGGVIGVPVTILEHLDGGVQDKNCRQRVHSEYIERQRICEFKENVFKNFHIVGLDRYTIKKELLVGGRAAINNVPKYARVFITIR